MFYKQNTLDVILKNVWLWDKKDSKFIESDLIINYSRRNYKVPFLNQIFYSIHYILIQVKFSPVKFYSPK